jgi:hypothetical protein
MISDCEESVSPIEIKWFQTGNYVLSTKQVSTVLEYNQEIARTITLLCVDYEVQKMEITFDYDLTHPISLSLNNYFFDATTVVGNKITFDFRTDAFDTFRIVTSSTTGIQLNRVDSVKLRLPENHQINQASAPVRFYKDEINFTEKICYFKGFYHPEIYHPVELMTFKGTYPFEVIIFVNDEEHFQGKSHGPQNLLKLKFNMEENTNSSLMIDQSIKHPSNLRKHFFNITNNYLYILITSEAETNTISLDCHCLEIKNIHLF